MMIFDIVVAGLESKQFGDETYYFDRSNSKVAIIEHFNRVTFMFYEKNESGDLYLTTELPVNRSIKTKLSTLKNFFVIPNIESRDDVRLLEERTNVNPYACDVPESVFEVISYGLLESKVFKGALFSNATINVVVMNSQGMVYEVPMVVDENVHGCDGNPKGKIKGAYEMQPIGIRNGNSIYISF